MKKCQPHHITNFQNLRQAPFKKCGLPLVYVKSGLPNQVCTNQVICYAFASCRFCDWANEVLALSAVGWGFAFSLSFWLELSKNTHGNPSHPPYIMLGKWERIFGQLSHVMPRQASCGSRTIHWEAAGCTNSPAAQLGMFSRGPESEFWHFSIFHMV